MKRFIPILLSIILSPMTEISAMDNATIIELDAIEEISARPCLNIQNPGWKDLSAPGPSIDESTALIQNHVSRENDPLFSNTMNPSSLPLDIWGIIIGYLHEHHATLSLVCKSFKFLSIKNNFPYLASRLEKNTHGALELNGKRLTIREISQILNMFEILHHFHELSNFTLPDGFKEKREEIFNYIHTLRWSPIFKKLNGPQRLEKCAVSNKITLKTQRWDTFTRCITRDPYLAIPFNIAGLSGIGALLWVASSYLPGLPVKYTHSPAFAHSLSCIWDPVGGGGADCYWNYRYVEDCLIKCATYPKSLHIPLSSLNTSEFPEVLSPITTLAQEECNMTDSIGLSEFVETSRDVFTSFVRRGNNEGFVTRVLAANERLHLFAAFSRSYIYDTYIDAEFKSTLHRYDPTCAARKLASTSQFFGYQLANACALIFWIGFFLQINYLGWT